jgi:hypothetical protein
MGFEGAQPSFDGTAMNNIFIQDEVESDSKDNQCLGETTKVKSWDEMFDHLKEYAEEHGDTNVPTQQGPLGRWVSNQRTFFNRLEKGKETYPFGTSLTWVEWKEKIHMRRDALEAIGFGTSHILICLFVLSLRLVACIVLGVGVSLFSSCYIIYVCV